MPISNPHRASCTSYAVHIIDQSWDLQCNSGILCERCLTLVSYITTYLSSTGTLEPFRLLHSRCSLVSTDCRICQRATRGYHIAQHDSYPLNVPSELKTLTERWCFLWQVEPVEDSRLRKHGQHISILAQYTSKDVDHDLYTCGSLIDGHFCWYTHVLFKLRFELPRLPEITIPQLVQEKGVEKATTDTRLRLPGSMTPNMRLIREWLDHCVANHTKCKQLYGQNEHDWYPDRLIFYDENKSPPNFRIVTKDEFLPMDKIWKQRCRSRYLALSHCWGPPPDASKPNGGRIILTTSNITAWKYEIPIDSLAKTCSQAMKLSVDMGFHYLWIDSLCIMQDSLEDWMVQSATMSSVYKHATLTICAMSSTSDNLGMVHSTRDLTELLGVKIPLSMLKTGRSSPSKVPESNTSWKEAVSHYNSINVVWDDIEPRTPLFDRTWVFQEQELSRRKLGFGWQSLSWACDEHNESELSTYEEKSLLPSTLRRHQAKVLSSQKCNNHLIRKELLLSYTETWREAVRAYSSTRLTKQTDAIMAISAFAKELAGTELMMGRYLAGLWEHDVHRQLIWLHQPSFRARCTRRHHVNSPEYVAPSWSWLSVPGEVVYLESVAVDKHRILDLTTVIEADTTTMSEFAFGRITAGYLRLQGSMNDVRSIIKANDGGRSMIDATTGEILAFYVDAVDELPLMQSTERSMYWMPHSLEMEESQVFRCWFLVLLRLDPGDDNGYIQKEGEQLGLYRRVGLGTRYFRNTSTNNAFVGAVSSALFKQFVTFDNRLLHTLTLQDLKSRPIHNEDIIIV